MKKYIEIFFITLLALNFGCDSSTEPTAANGSLKGIVKDSQGNLLSDAKVFIIYDFIPGLTKEKPENRLNKPLDLNAVELTSFSASVLSSGVRLSWSTATELNNLGFEIQKKGSSNAEYLSISFVTGNGTTTDAKTYAFTDVNILPGSYLYRLKQIDFDSSFEYSPLIDVEIVYPNDTWLFQNFPNPFDKSTTFNFTLRKPSLVTFDIKDFNNNIIIPGFWKDTLFAGNYQRIIDFSKLLPSNGYKIIMKSNEDDGTSLTLEKEFILAYSVSDTSMFDNIANTTSQNGVFEIKYLGLPFGQEYVRTSESDPSPFGMLTISNKIKIVVYKSGYKFVEKEIIINPNVSQEIEFQLEAE